MEKIPDETLFYSKQKYILCIVHYRYPSLPAFCSRLHWNLPHTSTPADEQYQYKDFPVSYNALSVPNL